MYLSMWILADWLKQYNPVIRVSDGTNCLQCVRILSDWNYGKERIVYVASTKEFIPTAEQGVICVHDRDYLMMNTDDVEAVFNAVLDAFDYYNEWERKLLDVIAQKGTLQQLIDLATPVMQNPVLVVNSSHMVQAITEKSYTEPLEEKHHLGALYYSRNISLEVVKKYNENLKPFMRKKIPFLYNNMENFNCMSLQQNLFLENEHIGWFIVLLCETGLTKGLETLCKLFSEKIILWASNQEKGTNLIPQAEIFQRLLEAFPMEKEEVLQELEQIGWRYQDQKYILKIVTAKEEQYLWQLVENRISGSFAGCYAVIYEEALVVICNDRLYPLQNLLEELEIFFDHATAVIGVSYPFQDIIRLKEFYEQTEIAVKWGKKNGGGISYCSEHILEYIRELILQNEPVSLIHPVIHRIHQYDEEHKTEYLETTAVYLEEERNQGKTAQKLHIHKNTLIYRINRIEELFQIDWNDSVQRRQLMVSLLLFIDHS